jgi:shikimate dehydrogenase
VETVIDFIYSPHETMFLKMASDAGCKAINGIDILIFQAAVAYEIWTGIKISFECIETAIKSFI